MKQNKVSPLLAYVVQTQVAQRMGAREHVRQNNVKALQCISPALLKSLAFAVHRKNFATERLLGARQGTENGFLKEVCSFDAYFVLSSSFCGTWHSPRSYEWGRRAVAAPSSGPGRQQVPLHRRREGPAGLRGGPPGIACLARVGSPSTLISPSWSTRKAFRYCVP